MTDSGTDSGTSDSTGQWLLFSRFFALFFSGSPTTVREMWREEFQVVISVKNEGEFEE